MQNFRSTLLTLLFLVAVSPVSYAATLRTSTDLQTDLVHLSDLFDGVDHDRAIGPSPEIGNRIFVEAPQLDAIARQFNVSWHSTSLADRTMLSRLGRPFTREEAISAVRSALKGASLAGDADIDLLDYTPPMLPTRDAVTSDIQGLELDTTSNRFTALLTLTNPGMHLMQIHLAGRIQEVVNLPVANRRLSSGEIIAEHDLKIERIRAESIRSEVAHSVEQLIGMAAHRTISPDKPIELADLGRSLEIQKGQTVHIELEYPGLVISARGIATEGGALGDHVRVTNVSSHAVLDARVIGVGQVRLAQSPRDYISTTADALSNEARP